MTIKYGILGCGKHALQSHAIPGKKVDGLELTALYDISVAQLENFEAEYGSELLKTNSLDGFLSSDIDAVMVGTPDDCHFENLKQVLRAEKHVMVEKPIITKTSQIRRFDGLLEYATKEDLIVSSCHARRYDPPFVWLKNNLNSMAEDLGAVVSFNFDFSYHKPSKAWKKDRGLLLDHINHEIDLVNYLFGHYPFEAHKLADSFDQYHVVGKRTDGIAFDFKGTRRLDARKYSEFMNLRFERGDIWIHANKGIARVHNHETGEWFEKVIPPMNYKMRNLKVMENFAKAIRGEEESYLTREDLYVNNVMAVQLTEKNSWDYLI